MSNSSSGKRAKAISDRSGMAFPYSEMVFEWNGSLVHQSEFETKHPQIETRRHIADKQGLKNAKPDNDGYIGDFIPLRASGYTNTPKNNPNGKKFLALKIETDYKKQKEIYESSTTSTSPVDAPLGSDEIDF